MKPSFDELYNLYIVERLTTRQIGKQFNVSKTKVLRWLNFYGIEKRATGVGLKYHELPEPTRDELEYMVWTEHLDYRAIGKRFGISGSAIKQWICKYQIPRPTIWDTRRKGVHPTLPTEQELRELYALGQSLVSIGKQFGVSADAISQLCIQYGIQVKLPGWDGGKRFLCNDEHLVLSVYEQRVDNWLYERGIEHQYEPRLPFDHRCRSDFLANGWYIEAWGVTGNATYNERRIRKTSLYHQHNLPLIELEPYQFDTAHKGLWKRRLQKVLTPYPVSLASIFDAPQ